MDENSLELSDRYSPQEVESRIYEFWEKGGYFLAEDVSTKPPFSIIMPPPNVTGSLHLGHALNDTVQDTLVRWKRMSGFNTLWLPGTDHAGIATQAVVERELKKQGIHRKELGREKFLEKVWEWKNQFGSRIVEQVKRLGCSCDWNRLHFTLDEGVSKAVRKVFVDLYKKNLIYKGTRLINWSPKLESAISDLEVEHKEVKGHLWHIRYPVEGSNATLVVATTRPETMLGDTAVAVHPEDERYASIIGKNVLLPLTNRKIQIIADSAVDREFGSGAVKVTPAHDFNDYEMGRRHGLEMLNIMNVDGTLNANAQGYQGLRLDQARKKVVEDLEAQGLMEKIEAHVHSVGHCTRTGCVVEPLLSEQWFVKMEQLALPARRAVENGTTNFYPDSWTKTYLHWMSIIQDWCISRQLWWGHRIPAWKCSDCGHLTVAEGDPTACEKCQSPRIAQDDDVLDTWFSSALWPFSTMGWPNETEAVKTFYPTDILVTAHDIIFFWVARMMIMGLEFKKDVPFRKVYIHGLIRDIEGRKMSKSLNNSVDPVEIIEQFGADSLRFTLLCQLSAGRDLKFSQQRLEGYRNFMNKIWNATRFSLGALKDFQVAAGSVDELPDKNALSDADKWIIFKLGRCEAVVNEALGQLRFSEAAQAVYDFAWHEFCDWYLEFVKPIVYGDNASERTATQFVLAQTLNRLIRLLHPFIPFITEEIYQKIPIGRRPLISESYPTPLNDKKWLALGSEQVAFEVDVVREIITAIRNIRGENRIQPGQLIKVVLDPKDDRVQKIVGANKKSIMTMCRLETCDVGTPQSLSKCALAPVRMGAIQIDVVVPLSGLVDIEEEIARLRKNIEKAQKEFSRLDARLGDKNFLTNAPAEVVEEGKTQLEEIKSRVQTMQDSLNRLQS